MRLKELRRAGWVKKAKNSFMVAVIALLYGELFGLDPCKMMKLAIVHDIAEVKTGDLMPNEKLGKREEMGALREVTSSLPARLATEINSLWREYSYVSSEEARIVKQIDKLEMALQGIRYQRVYRSKVLRELTEDAAELVKDKRLRDWLSVVKS